MNSTQLAACYTFGTPRVGDDGRLGCFKTPIYRIINAAYPIPIVPPSGRFISAFKHSFRILAAIVPWGRLLGRVMSFLVRQKILRH